MQFPMIFFTKIEKSILKSYRSKKPSNCQSNGATVEIIKIPDFKTNYKATVIKTAWYWHKTRNEDQWNRTEDPDTNRHSYYSYLIF
jgi:hypothetical protein